MRSPLPVMSSILPCLSLFSPRDGGVQQGKGGPAGEGVWWGRGLGRGRGVGAGGGGLGEGVGDISSTLPYTVLPHGASP